MQEASRDRLTVEVAGHQAHPARFAIKCHHDGNVKQACYSRCYSADKGSEYQFTELGISGGRIHIERVSASKRDKKQDRKVDVDGEIEGDQWDQHRPLHANDALAIFKRCNPIDEVEDTNDSEHA